MSRAYRMPEDDPLYGLPDADRLNYATGMLLDAGDFADEQTYHRQRLARALAFACGAGARQLPADSTETITGASGLFGGGTLAGLRVAHQAASGTPPDEEPEKITIGAGLAVDRLGRLVEVPAPVCLRLQRWFDGEMAGDDGGDQLRLAAVTDPARFASARMSDAITAGDVSLPARAVVGDVFVRFVACQKELTPAFSQGPFDALDAAVPARLRDAYEVHFVPRGDGLDDDFDGLPQRDADMSALDAAGRRDALQDAVLDAWPDIGSETGPNGELPAPPGHPAGLDPTAVFLGRVFIGVGASDPLTRTGVVVVDNGGRRFLPHLAMLAGALGLGQG